jgi:tRNA-2-methylthio-N6-dimethylallyladenosine synthase
MNRRKVFLETFGCQMNVLDSELVAGSLRGMGYAFTQDVGEADLVLINTCSVRQHAEDKVYSRLGQLRARKQRDPSLVVGVMGCMAERDREGLLREHPHVDLLCGPSNLNEIPSLLRDLEASRKRATALLDDLSRKVPVEERGNLFDSIEALDLSREVEPGTVQAYVRVQRGCDKFCAFCVVPFTRGPERSRPPNHLVDETRRLAEEGVREITLLGQTVNSYVYRENGSTVRFADLLLRVSEVPGIERVRFVTSYPGDFLDDILDVMATVPEVCEYLHLPVQSGSDAVLGRMKRRYTVAHYEELMARARERVPGIALAGDFIVGFSGESELEFEATVDLLRRTRYKNVYVFKYSERPGTIASRRLPDDVSEEVKGERNARLLEVQREISLAQNQELLGREVEILVEGPSKAAEKARRRLERGRARTGDERLARQMTGRTRGDRIVVFEGEEEPGRLLCLRVQGVSPYTLYGISPIAVPGGERA